MARSSVSHALCYDHCTGTFVSVKVIIFYEYRRLPKKSPLKFMRGHFPLRHITDTGVKVKNFLSETMNRSRLVLCQKQAKMEERQKPNCKICGLEIIPTDSYENEIAVLMGLPIRNSVPWEMLTDIWSGLWRRFCQKA